MRIVFVKSYKSIRKNLIKSNNVSKKVLLLQCKTTELITIKN